jgi:hypothetical protein
MVASPTVESVEYRIARRPSMAKENSPVIPSVSALPGAAL